MSRPTLHAFFGGKSKIGNWLKDYIPNDYKLYIEPFSGSFAVYFLTDIKDNVEVIFNDLNRDQTNLVACSKQYKEFYNFLKNEIDNTNGLLYCKETTPELIKKYYRELYYTYKNSDFRNEKFDIPDMKRASVYAFLLTSAFSSCSYTAAGFSGFKLKTFLNKLQNKELQKKLEKINVFETLDFEEVIKKYDSPDTFMYLDPPYFSNDKDGNDTAKRSSWYGTKDEFGQAEHFKLLELLKITKSRWALSYYDFPALRDYLPKDKFTWLTKDFFRSSASFSENKEIKGSELLILNYDPKHISSYTPISEKLIDEIEEENGGAFISSSEKTKILKDFANKFMSNQKDIDPEIAKIINKPNFFKELLETEKKLEEKKKDEDIDDFWNN